MHEDTPSRSGEIRIASITGLGGFVLRRWPIEVAGKTSPGINLILRERDDGEIHVAIEEDWEAMGEDQ
jgi:hypothetical protein